jgi:hypothetical protein
VLRISDGISMGVPGRFWLGCDAITDAAIERAPAPRREEARVPEPLPGELATVSNVNPRTGVVVCKKS